MGIISSFFGERPAAPQTGGFTVGSEIPQELAPYYKDILGKAQALYEDKTAEGYQPYTGPSLAEFTPEQQQAFTGISGLQGLTAPKFDEAAQLTRDAAAPITTEQITEYMNPYQQAVVDIEKREAQKQFESQVVPQLAQQAAQSQAFGGSRQGILEGMAADTQQRLLADIQAKGSAQAYQDAVQRLEAERSRTGQAAGQLATMAPNQFKTRLGEIGALQTVGEEKQKLTQQALNEAYAQYFKEQQYPYETMGRYQSVVTGAPLSATQYVPPPAAGPSIGQQLLGGAATMLGTYGAFGGKMPNLFGTQSAKTGGGIADLPVIKAQDGTEGGLRKSWGIQRRPTSRYLHDKLYPKSSNLDVEAPSGGWDYLIPKKFRQAMERLGHNIRGYNYFEDKPDVSENRPFAIDPSGNPIWGASGENLPPDYFYQQDDAAERFGLSALWEKIKDKVTPPYHYLDKHQILKRHLNAPKDPSHFRNPSENPIWQEDDSGLLSISSLKSKASEWWEKQKRDEEAVTEALREAVRQPNVNPLYDQRPPIHADVEDIYSPTGFKQDISKLQQLGLELIGDAADVSDVIARFGANAANRLLKIGDNYFLTPKKGEEFEKFSEVYPYKGRVVLNRLLNSLGIKSEIPSSDLDADKQWDESKENVDKGIIAEGDAIANKYVPKIQEFTKEQSANLWNTLTEGTALNDVERLEDATLTDAKDAIINFYTKVAFPPLDINKEEVESQVDNLFAADETEIKRIKKIADKHLDEINNSKSKINTEIVNDKNEQDNAGNTYDDLITQDQSDKPVPPTKLEAAQDTWLKAVEKMNEGLNKKDALIKQAQQESMWAFVARVGANISKGNGIAESLANELPQAMKDRQSLTQAKSDLDDKKLAGKVDVAKAGVDVESSRTAARIAKKKEVQRQIEALRDDKIAYLRAINTGSSSDRKFSLPTSKEIEDYTDITSDILNGIADGSRDLSTYFNANDNINIAGVNNQEDLNSAFELLAKNKTFMTDLASYLNNNKFSDSDLLTMDNAISLGIKHVLANNKYSYNKEKGIIKLFDKKEITKR
tara:strand:- start:108 stop:3272 length:3165 start_codon:yes stop_codon:yes gene_type:complete